MELLHLLKLTLVPGIGPVSGKSLIGYCGSAEAVFKEKKRFLEKIPGIGKNGAATIKDFKGDHLAEAELKYSEANQIRILTYTSDEYPARLKQLLDSPLVLFVKGNVSLNHDRYAGIVGTRRNTASGHDITFKIVEGLKNAGIHTISGLAIGIDACAHKASVEYGIPSLGVVAHGMDMIYPQRHASLAEKMIDNGGAIISETFHGTALHPDLFPRRNRIVAGMSDALIVIESQIRGGSMITAQIAHSYDREVFAVPGRPEDSMSSGCNFMIKSLKAILCESATDVLKEMNWQTDQKSGKQSRQLQVFNQLNPDEKQVFDLLKEGERHVDVLLTETDYPMSKLTLLLLEMEMKGLVRSLPGKTYRLAG